jgi:hypothetical protein
VVCEQQWERNRELETGRNRNHFLREEIGVHNVLREL